MPNKWTDAQKQVLEHCDDNLLVSASAGSGKTSVLIEKIISLICSGNSHLKNMLVVTFTNSASLEIKQRLLKALKENGDEKLLEEIDDLSTSDILTFDGFCIKVVREFGYEIGQNNNFSVADNSLSGFLKNQALDNLLLKKNKNPDVEYSNAMDIFFENRNDSSFRSGIISLYEFLNSKSDDKFYAQKLDEYYDIKDDFSGNQVVEYLNNYILSLRDNFLNTFLSIQIESSSYSDIKFSSAIEKAIQILFKFGKDFKSNLDVLKNLCNFDTVQSNKSDDFSLQSLKEQYKDAKNNFNKAIKSFLGKEILELSFEEIKSNLSSTKTRLKYLLDFTHEFEIEYSRLKQNLQVFDFLDIEKCAKKILENSQIAEAIKNRYDWIFIDEYQDTSLLQESIVSCITTNRNLFMVGDFKQSIYRFRQAEPKIFIGKYDAIKSNQTNGNVIELKTNFRSENSILQFNNFVFDHIYKKEIDDFEYSGNSDLEFGGTAKQSTEEANVKILIVNQDEKDEEVLNQAEEGFDVYSVKDSTLQFDKTDAVEKEALLLVTEIKDMLNKKYYDAKSETFNDVTFADIAVLSRSKNSVLPKVKKILNDSGIPVTATFNEKLVASFDMQILLSFVKTIQNPQNDVNLISSLSNIGKLSFDELSTIKQEYKDCNYFYNATNEYAKSFDDDISKKLNQFFGKLKGYKQFSSHSDICELLLHINECEGLEQFFAVNNYGAEYESHFNLLLNSIQSIKSYGLFEFVNFIETFGDELEFETVTSDGENSVTLSTIHKAKGLEYPVVFLIGASRQFKPKEVMNKVLKDNDFGIAIKSFDLTSRKAYTNPIYLGIKQKIIDENKKEEKRLLYVALTRPKNYLTIIGSMDTKQIQTSSTSFDISSANSYLSWILGCFSESELEKLKSNFEFTKALKSSYKNEILTSKIECKIVVDNFDFDKKFNITNQEQVENVNDDLFNEILSHKFEKNNLSKKNSVTQIMSEEEHYNITNFDYRKNDKASDEDFLKIGTAYHKYMELLDFSENEEYLKSQIASLKALGKILQEDEKLVDESKIVCAIKSLNNYINFADNIFKEKQFLAYMPASEFVNTNKTNKILVQGVADLIIEKENEIYLVDYKTSRLREQDFKEKYLTQLNIYKKAIESCYKKPVSKKIIYSFHLGKVIEI